MKWIGQHIWCWITRFKSKVYFEDRVDFTKPVKYNGADATIQITDLDSIDDAGQLVPLLWNKDT